MATERNRALRLALFGILAIYLLSYLAYRLPEARQAPAGEFSGYRAQQILKDLLGNDLPHPMGSEANATLRTALVMRLQQLGYEVEVQSGLACTKYGCGVPSNLIAHLPSLRADEDVVLLASHYDSVPAGPGASDDGVGVANSLEIARILAARPAARHPVALLISDGEENGLLGAELFLRHHPLARHVRAAVNMEARGASGPSLMFETGAANDWLMPLYAHAIARPITDSLFYVAYQALPNDTDFSLFKQAGIEGFNFAFLDDVGLYHTALDTAANASLESIQHQGDNALAAVSALAAADSLTHAPGERVFLDLFSRVLLSWSAPAGLAAAVLVLLLLAAEAVMLVRAGRLQPAELLWGVLGVFSMLVLAVLLSCATLWASRLTRNLPSSLAGNWLAQPQGMYLASSAVVLVAWSLASSMIAKRARFEGIWLATALFSASSFAALAHYLPGASFIAAAQAAAAALAGIAFLIRRQNPLWPPGMAAVLPAWTTLLVTLPVAGVMYSALGSVAWLFVTPMLAMAALPLLPLLAAPTARDWRRRVLLTGALCVVAGLGFTLMMPLYSAQWPLRLDFEYRLDADAHQAWWVAEPYARRLPAESLGAAPFAAQPKRRFADTPHAQAYFAEAPVRELPAPELSAACGSGDARHVTLHLVSPRGAKEAFILFSAADGLTEAVLRTRGGEQEHLTLSAGANGQTRLTFSNLPAEGVEVEVAPLGPIRAEVYDMTYQLEGGEFLQKTRGVDATRSQDGDVTVVQRTVSLCPASGR